MNDIQHELLTQILFISGLFALSFIALSSSSQELALKVKPAAVRREAQKPVSLP